MSYMLRVISYKKGFTLIELLLVITIIGILSSFVVSNFSDVRVRARDGQRKSDFAQIQSALEFYRSDQGSYPASITFGSALTGGSPATTYMQKIPLDPRNGAPYTYSYTGGGTSYTLRTCLENERDQQRDLPSNNSTNPPGCNGNSNWSYTRTNP